MKLPRKTVIRMVIAYFGHLAVSIYFILMLGMAQFGQAFHYSPDVTPRSILWIINPIFMIVLDAFFGGSITGSTLDPHLKAKQIGYFLATFGSSAICVLGVYLIGSIFMKLRRKNTA